MFKIGILASGGQLFVKSWTKTFYWVEIFFYWFTIVPEYRLFHDRKEKN